MTITNIMHVSGSKADLYSPSYFKELEGMREPVNPFSKWVDGNLYAFGLRSDQYGQVRIVIDLTAAAKEITFEDSSDPVKMIEDKLNEDELKAKEFEITNPPIPPSKSHTEWIYQHKIREHQYSSWVVDPDDSQSGRWVATTEEETQWYKDDGSFIEPVVTDHTEPQNFFTYYLLNNYDFPTPEFIDLDLMDGDNIEAMRLVYVDHFAKKYGKRPEDVDVKIYHVDFRQAHHLDTDTEYDSSLMGYWLGKKTVYPKMISVDQNPDVTATFGSHTEPNMEGDFEYRHALHDAVFGSKNNLFNLYTTLPICNGLCCYPRVVNGKVYASEGQRLSYNEKDRNRRWVLVDFNPVGGCQFIHLSELKGTLSEFVLPSSFDRTKQTVLLVIRGRLFLPNEFEIMDNNRVLFNLSKFSVIYELDRMLCRGDFVKDMSVLEPKRNNSRQLIISGVSDLHHNENETIGDTRKDYPNGRQTIDTFKKTDDIVFQEDKLYYVKFCDEFVAVDSSGLIGQRMSLGHAVGISDPTNVYKAFVHDQNGQILFKDFYEATTMTSPVFDKGWEIKIKEPKLDLKNDDNSFVVIINKPGLQIVKHKCFSNPKPFTKMRWGSDSHAGLMRFDFDRQSRGLLFDETTRSIIDYTRETQSLTFYADKFRRWGIANCYITMPTPIAVMDESSHNLMSARGFTLDNANTFKYDHIVWPNLSILDFVFRG